LFCSLAAQGISSLFWPDIAALLQWISDDEKKHCDKIRDMLIRSDAFAGSVA
jgi:hypothetical protein